MLLGFDLKFCLAGCGFWGLRFSEIMFVDVGDSGCGIMVFGLM